ncbi:MAG: hypothetical protein JJU05_17570 [Verrucomicrobia bacterium]|nr:hypothetical protein [Verrucomicrobiota bacterium]MCH8528974.1 hypothetical protein [Kiritimatiellia bacterium]
MMKKTALILIISALLAHVCANETAESPEALRERYQQAGSEERAEILQALHKQRAAAIQARFGTEGQALTPEERETAAAVLREEWQSVQNARNEAVQARKEIHRQMRDAMLRHRFDENSDGVLSDAERNKAEETLKRERLTYEENRNP